MEQDAEREKQIREKVQNLTGQFPATKDSSSAYARPMSGTAHVRGSTPGSERIRQNRTSLQRVIITSKCACVRPNARAHQPCISSCLSQDDRILPRKRKRYL